MAEYTTGLVNVTNGSATVVGIGTNWTAEVDVGDFFTIVDGEVIYTVASITDDTHIVLSVDYAGATDSNLSYAIARDFTTNIGLPTPSKGDIEVSTLITRAFNIIDAQLGVIGPAGTFLGLTDSPGSYSTQADKFVKVNSIETALEFASFDGSFLTLDDTPSSYSGYPSAILRVNGGSSAVEFGAITSDDIPFPLLAPDGTLYTTAQYAFENAPASGLMRDNVDGRIVLQSDDDAGIEIQVAASINQTLAQFDVDSSGIIGPSRSGGTGNIYLTAGKNTAGNGGPIAITAGNAGGANSNGGSITHITGAGNGTGDDGILAIRIAGAGTNTYEFTVTEFKSTKPIEYPSYTVGTLPSAATAGQQIFVSDESGGAVMAFSDGTNWRRMTDRAVVS